MVSFILADQLRSLVRASLSDFVALFDGNVGTSARLLPNAVPITFVTRAVLDKHSVRLEPKMQEIQTVVESFVNMLVVAVDQIPKIETQLFSNSTSNVGNAKPGTITLKPEQCIRVAFEETFPDFVEKCRSQLSSDLKNHLAQPKLYLKEFDRHKPLIEDTVHEQVTAFLNTDPNQEKMMEVWERLESHINTISIGSDQVAKSSQCLHNQCLSVQHIISLSGPPV